MNSLRFKDKKDWQVFVLIFVISCSIFLFTNHGHRYTSDEYFAYVQAYNIATLTQAPNLIAPEDAYIKSGGGAVTVIHCNNGILCSHAPIGHAISLVPFILFEKVLPVNTNFVFTSNDFDDPNYVRWRNSLPLEETFTFLFFGPIITALSVCVVYSISRTYEYSRKTSTIVSFLYGFTTIAWAYITTALNSIESTFFILLAFYFFRRFKKTNSTKNLIFLGSSLGFAGLVRSDVLIFGVILLIFLVIDISRNKHKIGNFASFSIPLIICGIIYEVINMIRYSQTEVIGGIAFQAGGTTHTTPILLGMYSLLFSPGAGIFIFSPSLLTIFISFLDFYKKNKEDLFIILLYLVLLLIFFGTLNLWHGFVAWGARYMLPVTPFLLLPLGASIERRRSRLFRIFLITLGIAGSFFSFMWLVQDASWFVWGQMGDQTRGLFSLAQPGDPLNMNPTIFWTFQNSQLTHAISTAFTHLQVDLFLFKVIGPISAFSILGIIVIPLVIFLMRLLKSDTKNIVERKYDM